MVLIIMVSSCWGSHMGDGGNGVEVYCNVFDGDYIIGDGLL